MGVEGEYLKTGFIGEREAFKVFLYFAGRQSSWTGNGVLLKITVTNYREDLEKHMVTEWHQGYCKLM